MEPARVVLTAWSAVSPYGIGREAFTRGVCSGAPTVSTVDTERWDVPDQVAHLLPGFDQAALLGKKGTRAMDRVTAIALVTTGLLAEEPGVDERTALVLGTTTGSLRSMMEFTRSSLVASKPTHVDPATIPNAVMNRAAGQCAIWFGLRGPNTTLAGGRAAGLGTLGYAKRLLDNERATHVLAGVVEEFSDERSRLEHRRWGPVSPSRPPLGEGGVLFLVERADSLAPGRRPLAEILAVTSRVHHGDAAAVLRATVLDALEAAGVSPTQVWAATGSGFAHEAHHHALDELFDHDVLTRVPDTTALVGDTGACGGGFALAGALASVTAEPAIAVITAVEPDGLIAVAVLRLTDPPDPT